MRAKLSAFALSGVLVLSAASALAQEVPQPVIVTNLPDVQAVSGELEVTIEEPVPSTRLLRYQEVVTPGVPENPSDLTDGGTVEAGGFTSAVLSVAGEVKGTLARDGRIGALLVPDEPELVKALREDAIVALARRVEVAVGPATTALFSADQVVRLGFPRYRIFFFNSTPRAAEVKLWVYLSTDTR